MVVIFEFLNTSSVLVDLFWDTAVSVLFKASQSLVWVEMSIETDSVSSGSLIPATIHSIGFLNKTMLFIMNLDSEIFIQQIML